MYVVAEGMGRGGGLGILYLDCTSIIPYMKLLLGKVGAWTDCAEERDEG